VLHRELDGGEQADRQTARLERHDPALLHIIGVTCPALQTSADPSSSARATASVA